MTTCTHRITSCLSASFSALIACHRMLAIKRLPHSEYKFAEQRRNYQQVRFLRYVPSLLWLMRTCTQVHDISRQAKGHSNIVSLMRCTMYKEELWVSLEYLLGGTLEEMLELHALKEKHIKYIARFVPPYPPRPSSPFGK